MIKVNNLTISDSRNKEILVNDLSFEVKKNTCLAIVGESGSGKSMTVKSMNSIHKPWIKCTGEIIFGNKNILATNKKDLQKIRGKEIFMIFQDAMSAFDPSYKIGDLCVEILSANINNPKSGYESLLLKSMKKVLLKNPHEIIKKYPHQLSGGMLQRIIISLSLALEPKLIIADEPTTSLDTITQFEVVEQFKQLKKELNTTMIFISHDLGIVRELADYVVLMKNGKKVEEGCCQEIFANPKSEYSKYLIGTRKLLAENFKNLIGGN